MKKLLFILFLALTSAIPAPAQETPLQLVQTITVPSARKWDQFGVDLKGNRLFVTSEEEPAVEVSICGRTSTCAPCPISAFRRAELQLGRSRRHLRFGSTR